MWGKSMRELVRTHPQEMRRFASEFRDVLYEMPFQVPEDLVFLGRCVAILSGMCTGLNPDFNLFEGMIPFAQKLLAEERGDGFEEILSVLLEQLQALSTLPARLDRTLTRVDRGEVTLKVSAAPDLQRDLERLTRSVDRLGSAVIFAALLMVSGLLYINGEVVFGAAGLVLSLLAFLWTLRGRGMRW
jgi:predicted unusual protein kinase regulating ubiquinone biosynthesis (AarF/ABC1/UbiB family)